MNKRLLLAGMVAFALMSPVYSAEPQALWTSHGGSQGTAAAFTDLSDFTANPATGKAVFNFDLEMRQSIASAKVNGDFSVYVNSKDGGLAITDASLARLAWDGRVLSSEMAFHFLLMNADGGGMLCGEQVNHGKMCFTIGDREVRRDVRYETDYLSVMTFFSDIAMTPQDVLTDVLISPAGAPLLTHVRSQFGFADNKTVLWYDNNPSPIKTEWPILGFGVGLIKDYTTLTNRVVAHAVDEEAEENVAYHLQGIYPSTFSFDTSQYYLANNIFDDASLAELSELGVWTDEKLAAIALLQLQSELTCLPGDPGQICREPGEGVTCRPLLMKSMGYKGQFVEV